MGFEFRILGPLEVRLDGTPLRIGGPRQRALLAMLLLSANRVVSRDRLIDELLPDAPADTADHQLRVQVSRLRRVLNGNGSDSGRILTQAPGYVLRLEAGEFDLHRFEQLLREGDCALEERDFETTAEKLREAESLWRGRPLADLEFEPFARVDVERLMELRLVALETRIEAELSLGRHAVVVPELEAAVAEHPLRERLRGQLMLAMYRCGRQADALQTYRAGRAMLSEELALEPSLALRQLEQSILRQEAGLEFAEREPVALATEIAAPRAPKVDAAPPEPGDREVPQARDRRRFVLGVLVLGLAIALAAVAVVFSQSSSTLRASANSVGMIDTSTNALTAVVPAGGAPGGVAVGSGSVWETDTASDQLLQISRSGHVLDRIPVGRGPTGVAVGGGEVWVVNQLDSTVSEINPRALRQVASFAVGNGAGPIAYGDGSAWVANVIDGTVSRITPVSGRVVTIPLSGQPGGIALGSQGVWVTSSSTGQLLLIDPSNDEVTQQVQVGGSPAGVAVGGDSVWVANTAESTVARFEPATGTLTNINVGKAPVGAAYGAGVVWVADSQSGTVVRIDPRSGSVRLIRVGAAPTALAASGRELWTTLLPGPAAHRGGTLTIAEGPGYDSFDSSVEPAAWAGISQWQMLSITNDGLVTYRRVGGLAGSTVVPDLATSLPVPTDGGRTYTFQLRRGIRYSNGAFVRPEDFREEIERVFKLGNSYPELFYTGIVGAQRCLRTPRNCSLARGVIGDDKTDTVTFHLTAPDPDFLYKLAFPWADAVPADTPDRPHGLSLPPATGPYMTQSVTPSRAIGLDGHPLLFRTWTLVRNRRFRAWNPAAQPNGYPDKIVLTLDQNPGAAINDVERGRLDMLVGAPVNRLSGLATGFTEQFHSDPVSATISLAMNTRVAPFNNAAVRRALNYAIDRGRLVAYVGGPLAAQPSCQILPPTVPGYVPYCPYTHKPNASGSWRAPDIARAQKLIVASGTRGSRVTVLVARDYSDAPSTKIGTYLVSLLDRLGYRASLRLSNNPYPTEENSASRPQMSWWPWYSDYPAPSDVITLLLTCGSFVPDSPSNINVAEFCDRKIDGEVKAASALQGLNPGAASEAWSRIDRAVTDQAPWLPLYNPRVGILTSSRVGNYQYHPFFTVLLDQLWVR